MNLRLHRRRKSLPLLARGHLHSARLVFAARRCALLEGQRRLLQRPRTRLPNGIPFGGIPGRFVRHHRRPPVFVGGTLPPKAAAPESPPTAATARAQPGASWRDRSPTGGRTSRSPAGAIRRPPVRDVAWW